MSDSLEPEVKNRNRQLGRMLTILVIVLAVGTYVSLQLTRFNPFDKPAIPQQSQGGM